MLKINKIIELIRTFFKNELQLTNGLHNSSCIPMNLNDTGLFKKN